MLPLNLSFALLCTFLLLGVGATQTVSTTANLTTAAGNPCEVSGTINVPAVNGTTFGCKRTYNYGGRSLEFVIGNSSTPVAFKFVDLNILTGSLYVTSGGKKVYGDFKGNKITTGKMVCPAGVKCVVQFESSLLRQDFSFQLIVTSPPTITTLKPGSPQTLSADSTQGGFLYFSQPMYGVNGTSTWQVDISSYEGLKPPTIFTGKDFLPNLKVYDGKNDTTKESQFSYSASLSSISPFNTATNYLGIYLYGTASNVKLTPTWKFDDKTLPIMEKSKIYDNKTIDVPIFYRIETERFSQLKFQFSRQSPGGYPIVYLRKGQAPTKMEHDYELDTRNQDFFSLDVNNPYDPNAPNPGTWIIRIESEEVGGYLMKWTS